VENKEKQNTKLVLLLLPLPLPLPLLPLLLPLLLLPLLQLFYGPLDCVWDYPGEPIPERLNQEGKTNLDLLEQEILSGSSISCTYANLHLAPDRITTPASHHSVFTGWMPFLLHNQEHQSTEGTEVVF